MYLLKCDKCNNLIEVKTEFLMLCPHCKTKLKNSFQDWKQQKENKEKSFPMYLDEVCISSDMLEEQQKREKLMKMYSPKKNKMRRILNYSAAGLLLALAIIVALMVYTPYISTWWMGYMLTAINVTIALIGGGAAAFMAYKRKKFQTFVPAVICLAAFALIIAVDTSFLVITGNI